MNILEKLNNLKKIIENNNKEQNIKLYNNFTFERLEELYFNEDKYLNNINNKGEYINNIILILEKNNIKDIKKDIRDMYEYTFIEVSDYIEENDNIEEILDKCISIMILSYIKFNIFNDKY